MIKCRQMKFKEWKAMLKAEAKGMPEEQLNDIIEFYNEEYATSLATGFAEEETVERFGSPKEAIKAAEERNNTREKKLFANSVLFALLCAVLSLPILVILAVLGTLTVVFAVLPFALLIAGAGFIISGFAVFTGGRAGVAIAAVGVGLIVLGVGICLVRIMFALIRQLWRLFVSMIDKLAGLYKGGVK